LVFENCTVDLSSNFTQINSNFNFNLQEKGKENLKEKEKGSIGDLGRRKPFWPTYPSAQPNSPLPPFSLESLSRGSSMSSSGFNVLRVAEIARWVCPASPARMRGISFSASHSTLTIGAWSSAAESCPRHPVHLTALGAHPSCSPSHDWVSASASPDVMDALTATSAGVTPWAR
jgi:hypothetical protein